MEANGVASKVANDTLTVTLHKMRNGVTLRKTPHTR